jgi:hypothetical protein
MIDFIQQLPSAFVALAFFPSGIQPLRVMTSGAIFPDSNSKGMESE